MGFRNKTYRQLCNELQRIPEQSTASVAFSSQSLVLPLDSLIRRLPIETNRQLLLPRPLRVSINLLPKVPRPPSSGLQRIVTLPVQLAPQKEVNRATAVVDHDRQAVRAWRGDLDLDDKRRVAVDVRRRRIRVRPYLRVLFQLVIPEPLHRAERVDRRYVHPRVPRVRERDVKPGARRERLAFALSLVRRPVGFLALLAAVSGALAACTAARCREAAHRAPDVAREAADFAHAQGGDGEKERELIVLPCLVAAQERGSIGGVEVRRVHVEDPEEELLGEEGGGLDLDGVLTGLHAWAWFVEEIGGGTAGENAAWSVLVEDDEDGDVVRQRVDVHHLTSSGRKKTLACQREIEPKKERVRTLIVNPYVLASSSTTASFDPSSQFPPMVATAFLRSMNAFKNSGGPAALPASTPASFQLIVPIMSIKRRAFETVDHFFKSSGLISLRFRGAWARSSARVSRC